LLPHLDVIAFHPFNAKSGQKGQPHQAGRSASRGVAV